MFEKGRGRCLISKKRETSTRLAYILLSHTNTPHRERKRERERESQTYITILSLHCNQPTSRLNDFSVAQFDKT